MGQKFDLRQINKDVTKYTGESIIPDKCHVDINSVKLFETFLTGIGFN